LITSGGIFLQALERNGLQIARHLRIDLPWTGRFFIKNAHDEHAGFAPEGRFAGQQLE